MIKLPKNRIAIEPINLKHCGDCINSYSYQRIASLNKHLSVKPSQKNMCGIIFDSIHFFHHHKEQAGYH